MNTWTPEKTLRNALETGIACDLTTFSECVQFMYNHYDVFFLIAEYSKQNTALILYCYSMGLVYLDPKTGKYKTSDIPATEALAILTEKEHAGVPLNENLIQEPRT